MSKDQNKHPTVKKTTQPDVLIQFIERSQNTVLLASTQAVYKALHSTVQHTHTHTQTQS